VAAAVAFEAADQDVIGRVQEENLGVLVLFLELA
jgi:hypothetical protein